MIPDLSPHGVYYHIEWHLLGDMTLTAGLEIEVFQTILKKAYFINGCDVIRSNVQVRSPGYHPLDCVRQCGSNHPIDTTQHGHIYLRPNQLANTTSRPPGVRRGV